MDAATVSTSTADRADADAAAGNTANKRRTLDSLPTGRRLTGEEAAARTAMVRRLRLILPGVALALIAAFFLTTRTEGVDDAFLEDFKDVQATPENLRMANPHITGVDASGNPFDITAAEATSTPDRKDYVSLTAPTAVTRDGEETTTASADNGLFSQEENLLELENNVTLDHRIGAETYRFVTPAATVAIDDQRVTTTAGVDGVGPNGETLRADRMNANNRDGRVIFEGNVSMRIYPSKTQTPALREGDAATERGEVE